MPCTVSVDQSLKENTAPFILGNVGGRKGINDHEVHMDYCGDTIETDTKPSGLISSSDTARICPGSSRTLPLQNTGNNKLQSVSRNFLEDAKTTPLGRPRLKRL